VAPTGPSAVGTGRAPVSPVAAAHQPVSLARSHPPPHPRCPTAQLTSVRLSSRSPPVRRRLALTAPKRGALSLLGPPGACCRVRARRPALEARSRRPCPQPPRTARWSCRATAASPTRPPRATTAPTPSTLPPPTAGAARRSRPRPSPSVSSPWAGAGQGGATQAATGPHAANSISPSPTLFPLSPDPKFTTPKNTVLVLTSAMLAAVVADANGDPVWPVDVVGQPAGSKGAAKAAKDALEFKPAYKAVGESSFLVTPKDAPAGTSGVPVTVTVLSEWRGLGWWWWVVAWRLHPAAAGPLSRPHLSLAPATRSSARPCSVPLAARSCGPLSIADPLAPHSTPPAPQTPAPGLRPPPSRASTCAQLAAPLVTPTSTA
jgi:hypothetical protein